MQTYPLTGPSASNATTALTTDVYFANMSSINNTYIRDPAHDLDTPAIKIHIYAFQTLWHQTRHWVWLPKSSYTLSTASCETSNNSNRDSDSNSSVTSRASIRQLRPHLPINYDETHLTRRDRCPQIRTVNTCANSNTASDPYSDY